MSEKLLRCPFCGGEPRMQVTNRWPDGCGLYPVKGHTVVCENMDCPIYHADKMYYKTPEAAAKVWNTRVGYDSIQAEIDAFMNDLSELCQNADEKPKEITDAQRERLAAQAEKIRSKYRRE